MKRIIIIVIIDILSNSFTMAQNLKLGGSADILLGGKNISYMFGPSIILEYRFQNLPFSILANTHFYLSELSDEEKYLSNFSYTTFGLGASVNYYPFSWAIE